MHALTHQPLRSMCSPKFLLRNDFATITAASLLLLLFAVNTVGAAEPAKRPNIIVIVGDDMGYHDIGVQGATDVPTPNLDSLASNGVRCSNGYVSGPYCSPTRAGLLTGRYQQRFGHEFNPGPAGAEGNDAKGLDLKQTTLADRLKSAGYATGMVGKWHLGSAPEYHPLQRGFQEYFGFLGGALTYFPQKGKAGDQVLRGTEPANEKEYLTDAFGREACSFVDRHKAESFFLYLTFNAVHTPMEATDKYRDRFANVSDKRRQTYCAMMSAMDDAVGSLLTKLRNEKLEENTLIFFVSDNGGPTAANGSDNTPLRGVKATTWEGGVRVPFLVQWKGQLSAGQVYDKPVIQLDITPTALAAAGVATSSESGFDGVDLLPYLKHGDGSATRSEAPHKALFWRFGAQTAVRLGDWKLTQARDPAIARRGVAGAETLPQQLFNLADDVGEKNDLSAKHPEKVKELQLAYEEWNKSNIAPKWGQPNQVARPRKNGAKAAASK